MKGIQPKIFVPRTTRSKGVKVDPNLLKDIKLGECAPTKIIIGDIPYIPLQTGLGNRRPLEFEAEWKIKNGRKTEIFLLPPPSHSHERKRARQQWRNNLSSSTRACAVDLSAHRHSLH